eukprot:g48821.t1
MANLSGQIHGRCLFGYHGPLVPFSKQRTQERPQFAVNKWDDLWIYHCISVDIHVASKPNLENFTNCPQSKLEIEKMPSTCCKKSIPRPECEIWRAREWR